MRQPGRRVSSIPAYRAAAQAACLLAASLQLSRLKSPLCLISVPLPAVYPSRVVRGQVGAGDARDACTAAERRFAFQERPATAFPQGSALKHVLRPIPREFWQLFDVVAVLLENGWDNDRSETRIFSVVPSLKTDR